MAPDSCWICGEPGESYGAKGRYRCPGCDVRWVDPGNFWTKDESFAHFLKHRQHTLGGCLKRYKAELVDFGEESPQHP